MGEVYLGHDPRLQRRVALKCVIGSGRTDDDRARVLREARAAARLNHPNIAAVYDVLQQADRTFIVMELVEGETLAARMARDRIPIDQVRLFGRQLASALAAAHAQGVIHRDLKPANIHVTPEGTIKVLDFGVAKFAAAATDDATDLHSDPTLGGNPGTPNYMAPEQLFGRGVDARSDVYSAGVVLYQMVTGRRPYDAIGAIPLAVAMSQAAPPPPSAFVKDVPPDLDATIMTALARDPEDRFQNAREFEMALRTAGERSATAARTRLPSLVGSHRHEWRRRFTIAAAVIIVALGGFAVWRSRSTGSPRTIAAPASATRVLAVLPIDNPARDPEGEYLGAGIASIVARNFASVPGVTIVSREAIAPYRDNRNVDKVRHDLGVDYVIDLALKSPPPNAAVVARLWRPGERVPVWEEVAAGDPLTIEQTLLDRMAGAMDRAGVWPHPLTEADWTRIRRVPTKSGKALSAYSEARTLLDKPTAPGNVTRAIEILERAVRLDPSFALAYATLGDAYLEEYRARQDPELARKANDSALAALRTKSDDDAWSYYSLGNVQASTGRYQDAIASLRRSLEMLPDNDETHRVLGQVLANTGDIDGAVAELQRAIRIRPDYWRHYMILGRTLYQAGRLKPALDVYRRASELQPDDPGPFSGLGLIYQQLGDLPQAIGNYEHAVSMGPNAAASSNLGLVYYMAGRYPDAVAVWKQALSLQPKSVGFQRNIGDAYRRMNQTQAAAAAYSAAIAAGEERLKINPRDADTISLIAVCEAKLGRTDVAIRRAAEARALASGNRLMWQRSAEVHALVHDVDGALNDLAAAIGRGYPRSIARDNDEFESLRKLPKFQQLVGDQNISRR